MNTFTPATALLSVKRLDLEGLEGLKGLIVLRDGRRAAAAAIGLGEGSGVIFTAGGCFDLAPPAVAAGAGWTPSTCTLGVDAALTLIASNSTSSLENLRSYWSCLSFISIARLFSETAISPLSNAISLSTFSLICLLINAVIWASIPAFILSSKNKRSKFGLTAVGVLMSTSLEIGVSVGAPNGVMGPGSGVLMTMSLGVGVSASALNGVMGPGSCVARRLCV